jgi:thiol-disulfide isomerase/thioredoxin
VAATSGSSPAAAPSAPGVVLTQAWATAPLVDVSTGETFRIADHAGKVVILETMAIWCSNCRSQQRDVQAALARLPADKVVFVVLDTDKSEDDASLAAYRTKQGFEGRYAVAGTDVARALAADFSDQFLNPPSTPMLVIGTDGTVTRTEFGHKSVDDIVALAEAGGA